MILPSFHLLMKHCRSSLFRTIIIRQFSTIESVKKEWKQQENEVLLHSSNEQIEINTFTQKGREQSP